MSLRVDALTVYYQSLRGDVKAVDGATFEIADGEIMGLAGESGCGKSTLGKSLIRMDTRMRYVSGHVVLDGDELPIWDDRAMNAYRFRDVSIIPQYALSALNPTRRIGTMATELLRSRDAHLDAVLPEFKRRLKLVGLPDDVLDRYPIELSGGMKQRVVMVLSSLLDPSLLIADEVTSALDVSTQRAVAELLVEFRDRGFVKSMIVITHDLSVLYQIADTILVMYAGKLAEKAAVGNDHRRLAPPLHPAAPLLAPRGRRAVRREAARGNPGPAAAADRPADGLPLPGPLPARSRSARSSPRSTRSGPTRVGLLEGGRLMLELDTCCKAYKTRRVRRPARCSRSTDVSFIVQAGRGRLADRRERQRQVDDREDDPPARAGRRAARSRFDGADISTLEGRALKAYYGDVQGVFQDPFSSYNPIFKADRVFEMLRGAYFPGLSDADWRAKLNARSRP